MLPNPGYITQSCEFMPDGVFLHKTRIVQRERVSRMTGWFEWTATMLSNTAPIDFFLSALAMVRHINIIHIKVLLQHIRVLLFTRNLWKPCPSDGPHPQMGECTR